jgi:hypothetical protein
MPKQLCSTLRPDETRVLLGMSFHHCPGCDRILKGLKKDGTLRSHQVAGRTTASLDQTRSTLWEHAAPEDPTRLHVFVLHMAPGQPQTQLCAHTFADTGARCSRSQHSPWHLQVAS